MIDLGPPKRVVAEVCIPDKEGGEICATAVDSFQGNGRTWVDCRVRARKLAEAARAGEEGVVICNPCVPTVETRQPTSGRSNENGLSRRTENNSEGAEVG